YFLQDAIKPKLQKSKALNKLLFESIGKSDVYLLAITRLVPIFPFNLQNFAYGITGMRFSRYSLFSALFILPGTAVYTIASAGVVSPEQRTICLVVAAVLLALTMGVAFVLKRKAGIEK
ncbi:MAG: TVP38/TMEM64 family protein, partial [Eggerthellaceae bacterium]